MTLDNLTRAVETHNRLFRSVFAALDRLESSGPSATLRPVPDREDPTMQECDIYTLPDEPPVTGQVVRCGHAGAVWITGAVIDTGEELEARVTMGARRRYRVSLEPVDPHEVPVSAPVRELPLPGLPR